MWAKWIQGPEKPFSKPLFHQVESATGRLAIPRSPQYVSDSPKIAFKVPVPAVYILKRKVGQKKEDWDQLPTDISP